MPLVNTGHVVGTNDTNKMTNLEGSTRDREVNNLTTFYSSDYYKSATRIKHDIWQPALYNATGVISMTGTEDLIEITLKGIDVFLSGTINANTEVVVTDSSANVYFRCLLTANNTSLDFGDKGMRVLKTTPGASFTVQIVNGTGAVTLTGWKI